MATDIPAIRRVQVKARFDFRCAVCGVPTMDGAWHHRRTRSVVDDHQHCSCNGVWLCHHDHRRTHGEPFIGRARGLIVTRHESVQPAERKMPYEHPMYITALGWVLLDCTGGYQVCDAPE